MYGGFFGDIDWAADGGLYAELVRHRPFEFLPVDTEWGQPAWNGTTGWTPVSAVGGSGIASTVNDDARMNERNRTHSSWT
jgi:hypothetical protein